jgi:hypothetical protein
MDSKRCIESYNGAIIGVDRRSRPKYVIMGFVCPVYMLKPQPKRTISSSCSFLQCRTSRSSLPQPWEVPSAADWSQDQEKQEEEDDEEDEEDDTRVHAKKRRSRCLDKLYDTVAITEQFFNTLSSTFVLHDVSHCASTNDQAALLYNARTTSSSSSLSS